MIIERMPLERAYLPTHVTLTCFTGAIPASMAELTNLTSLSIDDNAGLCAPSALADAPWYDEAMACE